jgi:PAS domain S-box-containing protein
LNLKLPELQEAMGRGRPVRLAAMAAAVLLMVALASMLIDVYSRVQILRTSPKDNAQWTILQTQTEYLRMRHSLLETSSGDPAGFQEYKKRFDIFYSRLGLLNTAAVTSHMRDDPVFSRLLGELLVFRTEVANTIDTGDVAFMAKRDSIMAATVTADEKVQGLVLNALAQFSRQSDRERRELANSMMWAAALSTALVLALLVSVASLRRRTLQLSRREQLLSESREQLSSTISAALDAVVITDASGKIIDWNGGAEAVFGHSREQVLGTEMASLIIPPIHREAHRVGMARYFATGQSKLMGKRIEIEALHANGMIFPVEMTLGVSRSSGQPVFIGYLRDISTRVAADQELKAALVKAEAANESKARFLAVMSHEMRTPLNGVIGALDLLDSTDLNKDQHRLVETALRAGDELLTHISDVLDFSKMEAGKLEIEVLPFRLETMLDGIVDMLTHVHPENGNEVSFKCFGGNESCAVIGDEQRIKQILLNLGTNALKFTRNGTVSIYCLRADNGNIRFSVADTGVGISEQDIPSLFREFSMIDSGLRRRSGGTGLGLAICKRLVEAMGGVIGVDSKLGQGSTFWFELPLANAPADITTEIDGRIPSLAQSGLRVLFVEDNATNRFVGQKMLEGLGHNCTLAENGKVAVEMLQEQQFDVVLLDISMPVMDGLAAVKIIRKMSSSHKQTPVIAMTANAVAGDRERFLREGFTGYLPKPVRRSDLMRAIAEINHSHVDDLKPDASDAGLANEAILDAETFRSLQIDLGAEAMALMLSCFRDDLERQLQRMEQALQNGNKPEIKKSAHAISGLAATMGANALNALATDLEMRINELELDGVKLIAADLRKLQVATEQCLSTTS